MNVLLGRTEQIKKTSGTYDSVFIAAHIFATAVNTALLKSAFNPNYVKVKVYLAEKDGAMIGQPMVNDSLELLGTYFGWAKQYRNFVNGIDKVLPAAAIKANKMRFVEIPFSTTRVNAGQELIVEVTLGQDSVFSAAVDTAVSYVQFEVNPAIGYDVADYETIFIPIQAAQPSVSQALGDNIKKIILLNFDKTDLSTPVVSSLSLTSDRLQETLDFNKLLARTTKYLGGQSAQLIGTALPVVDGTNAVLFGNNYLPQNHIIFDGEVNNTKIDKVVLDITLNSANVAASQNYIAVTRFKTNMRKVADARDRMIKHQQEEVGKLK